MKTNYTSTKAKMLSKELLLTIDMLANENVELRKENKTLVSMIERLRRAPVLTNILEKKSRGRKYES